MALTRMPSRRDIALRGRSARKVRIVLKAGILANPRMLTPKFKRDIFVGMDSERVS